MTAAEQVEVLLRACEGGLLDDFESDTSITSDDEGRIMGENALAIVERLFGERAHKGVWRDVFRWRGAVLAGLAWWARCDFEASVAAGAPVRVRRRAA